MSAQSNYPRYKILDKEGNVVLDTVDLRDATHYLKEMMAKEYDRRHPMYSLFYFEDEDSSICLIKI